MSDSFSAMSEVFNIEGKGEGTVQGETISGEFKGLFADYTRHGDGTQHGRFCMADDHRFSFAKH